MSSGSVSTPPLARGHRLPACRSFACCCSACGAIWQRLHTYPAFCRCNTHTADSGACMLLLLLLCCAHCFTCCFLLCVCVCVCVRLSLSLSRARSLSLSLSLSVCVCVCVFCCRASPRRLKAEHSALGANAPGAPINLLHRHAMETESQYRKRLHRRAQEAERVLERATVPASVSNTKQSDSLSEQTGVSSVLLPLWLSRNRAMQGRV